MSTASPPTSTDASRDRFSEVRPSGVLGRMLENISNPRRHRWNAYLRACKRIPKTSPVYGSTSFNRLNERRHQLIFEMYEKEKRSSKEARESEEFKALQHATSQWLCGPLVAGNFLLSRLVRRMEREYSENDQAHLRQPGK